MKIHFFQHVPFEGLALLEEWARQRNHSLTSTQFYQQNYNIPHVDQYDMLMVLGGPMSVHDEDVFSWLTPEKVAIKEAIEQDKYVLGICLGAQLVAEALGAQVLPNLEKEIGWFPINLHYSEQTQPLFKGIDAEITVFHWHGERFDIPAGAEQIASSAACQQQGFVYNKTLALQFHIEMDLSSVDLIVQACNAELTQHAAAPFVQNEQTIRQLASEQDLQAVLFMLLDSWIESTR